MSGAIDARVRPVTLMATVLACACYGCGDDVVAPDEPAPSPESMAEAAPELSPPEILYDADGALLESDVVVAGLHLPRGLELSYEQDRQHVYRTGVPLGKVQQYFGTRLITGQVDRMGDGAVYRQAVPRGVRGGVVKMDVSILPLGHGKVRVEVVELPPPPAHPPSEAEIRQRLEQDMRRWD